MLIIPAIDIKGGKCVRLFQGIEGTETVFSEDPVAIARRWESDGARLLHVVDLDGAFSGEPVNFPLVASIARAVSIPIQVGGGVRTVGSIKRYLEAGVSRVVVGTAAFNDRDFLQRACEEFPGRIVIGIDTKYGKIAVKGWKEVVELNAEGFMNDLKHLGISLVIHTDIDRDGTLGGVNFQALRKFLSISPLPVIASGGVSSLEDIEQLSLLSGMGLVGVILGKSIYAGRINLKEAIERFS
ncbi:MAG: 1-(5-phosphoribosyl)-5-[(5-phosphoribosylamino)methylideneamino]imidazole-4-carboxamide isomerase [Candidatus Caldarchaeum sp.]